MTKDEAVKKLIDYCQGEVGYVEGANNWNKYAEDPQLTKLYGWNVQNQPYCDIFVDEAFIQCFGYDNGKAMTYQYDGCGGAACRFSANYYQSHGAYVQYPEVGDQIFFYYDGAINHTGIVVGIDGNMVITVEGNSSDSVRRNSYAKTNPIIAGYGIPKWDVVATVANTATTPQPVQKPYTLPADCRGKGIAALQGYLKYLGYDVGRFRDRQGLPSGVDGDAGNKDSATNKALQQCLNAHGITEEWIETLLGMN